jgi:hypothetical protein
MLILELLRNSFDQAGHGNDPAGDSVPAHHIVPKRLSVRRVNITPDELRSVKKFGNA